MKVLDLYTVTWTHTCLITERVSRTGKTIKNTIWCSGCAIRKGDNKYPSSTSTFLHKTNHYDRKVGVKESFAKAVAICPSKDLRDAFWAKFWEIRKPTIEVSPETADLLSCVPFAVCELKKAIIKEDTYGYNAGWQCLERKDITSRLSSRLKMYSQDKSDASLIHIMKVALMGFINFKRK